MPQAGRVRASGQDSGTSEAFRADRVPAGCAPGARASPPIIGLVCGWPPRLLLRSDVAIARTAPVSFLASTPVASQTRILLPMRALLDVILLVLQLYVWVLIASAVLSWLIAFNVVNAYNPVVRTIGDIVFRLTEPVLKPIRSILPSLGGIDLSPMVLILLIFFIERVIGLYIYPYVF